MTYKDRLLQIRKDVTEIGIKTLNERTPLDTEKAIEHLDLFAKIETQIDEILDYLSNLQPSVAP